jgi:hypothetical protein
VILDDEEVSLPGDHGGNQRPCSRAPSRIRSLPIVRASGRTRAFHNSVFRDSRDIGGMTAPTTTGPARRLCARVHRSPVARPTARCFDRRRHCSQTYLPRQTQRHVETRTAARSGRAIGLGAPGDAIVVVGIDRLGRNAAEVMTTIRDLGERGIVLRSLRESVDTSNATGRIVAGVLASLAEVELEWGRERRSASGENLCR